MCHYPHRYYHDLPQCQHQNLSYLMFQGLVFILFFVLLGEVVLYNIFYEVFTVCTSIVAEDKTGAF